MSTLWRVRCLEGEGTQVTLHITNTHDQYPVHRSPIFVLQLLHEATWQEMDNGIKYSPGTLAKAITDRQIESQEYLEENVDRFIRSIALVHEQGEAEIAKLAQQHVTDNQGLSAEDEDWEDAVEDQMTEYRYEITLTIEVTDPTYLEHLWQKTTDGTVQYRSGWEGYAHMA